MLTEKIVVLKKTTIFNFTIAICARSIYSIQCRKKLVTNHIQYPARSFQNENPSFTCASSSKCLSCVHNMLPFAGTVNGNIN